VNIGVRHRLLVLMLALGACAVPARADIGINLYGLSYHFDQDKAKAMNTDNQVNPGLGVRWRKPRQENWDVFADAGFYKDSGRNTAVLAGGGAFWHATERVRLGGGLVLLHSATYNDNTAFIAPAPMVAYELRRFTINMVYFPKYQDVNRTNQVGFWLTWWVG